MIVDVEARRPPDPSTQPWAGRPDAAARRRAV